MIHQVVCALGMLSISAAALADDIAVWTIESDGMAADAASGESPSLTLRLNDEAFAQRAGRTLFLPLPGGERSALRVRSIQPSGSGGYTLDAELVGESGQLHLTRGLNATFGTLVADGRSWHIEGIAGAPVSLRPVEEIDLRHDTLQPPASAARAPMAADGAGNQVVDILYVYDQSMIDRFGWGLVDLAASDINYLDTALENSNVPLGASLTDMSFMSIASDRGGFTLIEDILLLRNGFENADDQVDALGADIFSLNREQVPGRDPFCGVAYLLNPTQVNAIYPQYNVCHNGFVLAHETGHNMGLSHGVQTDGPGTGGTPVRWAQGFRIDSEFENGGVYTSIMAYGSNVLGTFSDPSRPCPERGSVCGTTVDPATENGADAVRSLTEYVVPGDQQAGVPLNRMRSAVLPTSRFVQTGSPATVFMTVINPNDVTATNCRIQHHGPDRNAFTYQRTDPATNGAIGDPNTPVDIPARAFQTFVISLTPSTDVSGVSFAPFASCDNTPMAEVTAGLNTVNLGSDTTGGPDLVALAATINGNGIVDVPTGRRGVFSVATANIGGAGEVTVSARSLDPALPATGEVCQTNTSGACMATPAASVTLNVGAGENPTFGVFVRTTYPTPFVSRHRFQVQMEVNGTVRGSTSVAIRDEEGLRIPEVTGFSGNVVATKTLTIPLADLTTGYASSFEIVSQPTLGAVTLNATTGVAVYTAPTMGGSDSFTWRAVNSAGAPSPAAVDISVTALPLPSVSSIAQADDVSGTYSVDLDNFASGDIDRFVLTTPPTQPYTFDELRGVLDITLPAAAGQVGFSFAAENVSGRTQPASAVVDVQALTNCMPDRPTDQRMLRRLATYVTDTGGVVSLDEAELLAAHLCLTVTDRSSITVLAEDQARGLRVVFFPEQSRGPEPYYVVNYLGPNTNNQFTSFQLCKIAGETTMNLCAVNTNDQPERG